MAPDSLRTQLVKIALAWEKTFGTAPAITSAISELDAALLVGHTIEIYASTCCGSGRMAVSKLAMLYDRSYCLRAPS